LPRKVRACCPRNDGAQVGIAHFGDGGFQLWAEGNGRRDFARRAALGRSVGHVERSDAKPELVDGVASDAEAGHELGGEHL